MSARSAALKIEWAAVSANLGLKGNTASALSAFKKRNEDARRKLTQLQELPTTLDFSQYRNILKNQAVIDEVESSYKAFKPTTIELAKQLKGIESFEVQAIKNAEDTKVQVDSQLRELAKTLENIEGARPFDQRSASSRSVPGRTTIPLYMCPSLKSRLVRAITSFATSLGIDSSVLRSFQVASSSSNSAEPVMASTGTLYSTDTLSTSRCSLVTSVARRIRAKYL